MRTDDLFESEDDDRLARLQAGFLHSQIRYWLEANEAQLDRRLIRAEGSFEGSYILPVSRVNDAYDDLVLLLTPAKPEKVTGNYAAIGGFFLSGGRSVIAIPCLRGPGDATYLPSRFGVGAKTTFVHEFMHYLMNKRKPKGGRGSLHHAEAGDVVAYYNDPDEVNAYYQEAAHSVSEFMHSVIEKIPEKARNWAAMSTPQLISLMKEKWVDRDFLQHASPKTMRALDKRLARFVEASVRPILNKIVGQVR